MHNLFTCAAIPCHSSKVLSRIASHSPPLSFFPSGKCSTIAWSHRFSASRTTPFPCSRRCSTLLQVWLSADPEMPHSHLESCPLPSAPTGLEHSLNADWSHNSHHPLPSMFFITFCPGTSGVPTICHHKDLNQPAETLCEWNHNVSAVPAAPCCNCMGTVYAEQHTDDFSSTLL